MQKKGLLIPADPSVNPSSGPPISSPTLRPPPQHVPTDLKAAQNMLTIAGCSWNNPPPANTDYMKTGSLWHRQCAYKKGRLTTKKQQHAHRRRLFCPALMKIKFKKDSLELFSFLLDLEDEFGFGGLCKHLHFLLSSYI